MTKEKTSIQRSTLTREKSNVQRASLTRAKSTLQKSSAGEKNGKRPAWDLKGRLEDMEQMFEKTNQRILDLETEKEECASTLTRCTER